MLKTAWFKRIVGVNYAPRFAFKNNFICHTRAMSEDLQMICKTKPLGTHFSSGAIKSAPYPLNHNKRLLKALAVVFSCIYLGGLLSSTFAQILHELNIFCFPESEN